MGPKKGKGKSKGTSLIDGVDTSSMTREQLEAFAHRLRNEMEREREERNFFQLERDKLRTFWEITRKQLEETRAIIRNKEREVEVSQELSEVDIKHVVQQMKHLQYEHQTRLGEMKAEYMTQLKLAQEEHGQQEQELLKDKRELRRLLRENEESTELQLQQLKMHHTELLTEARQKFETELNQMVKLHEKKLEQFIEESTIKHHMEMSEVEERKNMQISRLIETHEKAFNDMKIFYNDITLNNLALIGSLKEQMEELRTQSERNEMKLNEVTAENKKLVEPLKEANAELVELRKKLEYYDRDRAALTRIKNRYEKTEKELQNIKWEAETLNLRCDTLTDERDQLRRKFEDTLLELQQQCGLKNVFLERKIANMEKDTEKREAILGEVLALAGLDSHALSIRVEKLLSIKNGEIDDLNDELIKVCKLHDDLLVMYETKLQQFGIKEENGLKPLSNLIKLKKIPLI